ncbi:HNH endonuclease [Planomicrobium sp. CPCC 101110]|uniref:HNH endonuclease n=1 Tax=Planomicrobium sp. CPCC 101110 TaxID=2599619 RepID=UPI0011B7EB5F|nr:HNH endonuclease [Planomicrobium sp. CPCC 101110]TWT25878.1 HNH endonuclease [Planomicrobium sp. CPCC 101110]
MNSFIVMQGETYQQEKKLGILWSPQQDKSGMVPHSYKRMTEVKKGDRILHYVKGAIIAISRAAEDCKKAKRPNSLEGADEADGYKVVAEYRELETPVAIHEHIIELAPFLPKKYSAFQEDGSGNPGYLYACNEELLLKLLEIISVRNVFIKEAEQLELAIEVVRRKEHYPLVTLIAETVLEAKTKMERSEQRFRELLLPKWNQQCQVCGVQLGALLKASYAKPWKDSVDPERVDPYNGIVLCANHDALYRDGYMAINPSGTLQISKKIAEEEYPLYGLAKRMKVAVYPENEPFFRWHKNNVFLDKRKRILNRPTVE